MKILTNIHESAENYESLQISIDKQMLSQSSVEISFLERTYAHPVSNAKHEIFITATNYYSLDYIICHLSLSYN